MDFGTPMELSNLQKSRCAYVPSLPPGLQGSGVRVELGEATSSADPSDAQAVSQLFPLTYGQPLIHFLDPPKEAANLNAAKDMPLVRVGILFSGRQSPGGHNVVCGLYDAIKSHNPKSILLGFCGGTEGLFTKSTLEITEDVVSTYRNQGGFNLLGRTKDQIRTTESVKAAMETCQTLNLDALVIIGGVISNTDAAQLAESFAKAKCKTKVIGVPVTIYGDLKNEYVEANVGFDTICKVNAQLISNLCTDALSAEKYYYFIRLMGRKASHVTLECALQSNPNMAILGEEVSSSMLTLFDLTKRICDAVQARAEQDKYHGVIILPEGLIGSIPEVHALMQEIQGLQKKGVPDDKISSQLTPWASALFEFLPPFIKEELLLSPESDDSAQLSQIETEKLLAQLVETEMDKRLKDGTYKGKKFNAICHFFGYQARGSLPSKFDCDFASVLGHVCYHLLAAGCNGYMATVTNLKQDISKWKCGGAPLTAMISVNRLQQGPWVAPVGKPSIIPAAVNLKGKPYQYLIHEADKLWMNDLYRNPGPIQFEGPGSDSKTFTLCAEDYDYMGRVKDLQVYLDQVKAIVKPGCPQEVLKAALSTMASVIDVLNLMSSCPSKGQILL